MKVSDITKEDAIACGQLLVAFKAAKFEIAGADLLALGGAVRWLSHLASSMGDQLRGPKPVAEAPAERPLKLTPSPIPTINTPKAPRIKK